MVLRRRRFFYGWQPGRRHGPRLDCPSAHVRRVHFSRRPRKWRSIFPRLPRLTRERRIEKTALNNLNCSRPRLQPPFGLFRHSRSRSRRSGGSCCCARASCHCLRSESWVSIQGRRSVTRAACRPEKLRKGTDRRAAQPYTAVSLNFFPSLNRDA